MPQTNLTSKDVAKFCCELDEASKALSEEFNMRALVIALPSGLLFVSAWQSPSPVQHTAQARDFGELRANLKAQIEWAKTSTLELAPV